MKHDCGIFGIFQKCATSLNKPDCGNFWAAARLGFVAVIGLRLFGACGMNPTSRPRNFGGLKTPSLKYLGLMWNFCPRNSTPQKFHVDKIGFNTFLPH